MIFAAETEAKATLKSAKEQQTKSIVTLFIRQRQRERLKAKNGIRN